MEKVLSSDMSKILMLLGGGAISLTALWVQFIVKLRGSFKPYLVPTLVYLLVCLLFFVLITLSVHPAILTNPAPFFVFYQTYFLLMGSAHVYFMQRKLKWSGNATSLFPEMIFSLVVGLSGSLVFILLYRWLNHNGMEHAMAGSTCFFIIPFFFYHTFLMAADIPLKIRKQWLYPLHEKMEEPDESKLKNLLVISFELEKQAGDAHLTNFRAKAPTGMEFNQLFYHFLNDYNEHHPNSRIQLADSSGEPHAWMFYKKPRWYSLSTKYIDTDKTIYNNYIRENDVIICSRSLN